MVRFWEAEWTESDTDGQTPAASKASGPKPKPKSKASGHYPTDQRTERLQQGPKQPPRPPPQHMLPTTPPEMADAGPDVLPSVVPPREGRPKVIGAMDRLEFLRQTEETQMETQTESLVVPDHPADQWAIVPSASSSSRPQSSSSEPKAAGHYPKMSSVAQHFIEEGVRQQLLKRKVVEVYEEWTSS